MIDIQQVVQIVGILGGVVLVYSQFVEAENRRDLIRMVGAAGLCCYAIVIGNWIFIGASAGVFFAALIEFLEIYFGIHKHKDVDINRYKKMKY